MSDDTMVPLSEVAELVVSLLYGQTKQAKPLDADTPAPGAVKNSDDESKDVVVKDVTLDNTKSDATVSEMSKGLSPVVDEFTSEGSQAKAVDESSAVMTERGSQHGEPITAKEAAVSLDTDAAQPYFLSDDMETLLTGVGLLVFDERLRGNQPTD